MPGVAVDGVREPVVPGMAKHVGVKVEAENVLESLEELADGPCAQGRARTRSLVRHEDISVPSCAGLGVSPDGDVVAQEVCEIQPYRDRTGVGFRLGAFPAGVVRVRRTAMDGDVELPEVDVRDLQTGQLALAHARVVEARNHGKIAMANGLSGDDGSMTARRSSRCSSDRPFLGVDFGRMLIFARVLRDLTVSRRRCCKSVASLWRASQSRYPATARTWLAPKGLLARPGKRQNIAALGPVCTEGVPSQLQGI